MIKISNQKSIKEINELRDKGLYNAPFSVLEAMGKVDIGADHSEVEEKLQEIELNNAMAMAGMFESIANTKRELEENQAESMVAIFEMMGGLGQ